MEHTTHVDPVISEQSYLFMIYPKLSNGHIFDKKDVISCISLKGHGPYDFD